MLGCLFERVGKGDQGWLAERASRKRHPEWCRIDDSARRWNETARDYNARVTRLGGRRGAAILRKQNGVEVVIGAFYAIWPIEDRVETGSGEGQVLSAVAQV